MSEHRYRHVPCRKTQGAHYTPTPLGDFVATALLEAASLGTPLRIIDPAIGDGELLLCLLKALKHHRGDIQVYGFDTNAQAVARARRRLKKNYPLLQTHFFTQDFLQYCLDKNACRLHTRVLREIPEFDLLIANPPYIRTQVMGSVSAAALRQAFALKGRVDSYQAFLVAMHSVLAKHAVAGVIVPNRFMTTKGGRRLREQLMALYEIKQLWDFGDTELFEAAVLPAVLLMSPRTNKKSGDIPYASIYRNQYDHGAGQRANDVFEALRGEGLMHCDDGGRYTVRKGVLAYDDQPGEVWRLQDAQSRAWLQTVAAHTWAHFGDIGKIRVGVKTTADKVFIREHWEGKHACEQTLLKPLSTHHVAARFRKNNKPYKRILYTHTSEQGQRKAIELAHYPQAQRYLETHRQQLAQRSYLKKSGRHWYEIWVPQDPAAWSAPKIIFRDISEQPCFWMDEEETVVNGDCYWLRRERQDMPQDILWLVLAVANSGFIETFYDTRFQNKLYANRRRFMTQYVAQFPLPDPSSAIARQLIALAQIRYRETDAKKKKQQESQLDALVQGAFGLR